jgi:hypothetical protein
MNSRLPIIPVFFAMLASGSPAKGGDSEENLLAAATTFCSELHQERISGLPSPEQWKRLAPLVTPELYSIFGQALHYQQEQIRKHPDEKPYWVEGDLFGSFYEGVTSWEIGEPSASPGVDATVRVNNTYLATGQAPITWADTLVFKQRDGRWLLDDIRMGSDWDFESGESLRSGLPGGIREEEDHDSPDGRWHIVFTREADEVTRITIAPTDASAPPVILFGENDETCRFPTFLVWSPTGDMFAISLGDGVRFRRSVVYRHMDARWQQVDGLKSFPEKKHAWIADGLHERNHTVEARYWQDASTLVLHYFGIYVKQDGSDESEGYDELLSVRIAAEGKASVVDSVMTPLQ